MDGETIFQSQGRTLTISFIFSNLKKYNYQTHLIQSNRYIQSQLVTNPTMNQPSSKTSSEQNFNSIKDQSAQIRIGRWDDEEHEIFLQYVEETGRDWNEIAKKIPTRTPDQVRSHAQKYFLKLHRQERSKVQKNDEKKDDSVQYRKILRSRRIRPGYYADIERQIQKDQQLTRDKISQFQSFIRQPKLCDSSTQTKDIFVGNEAELMSFQQNLISGILLLQNLGPFNKK